MPLPRIDRGDVRPGDRITVLVGGQPYETVIDERGTQRFVENPSNALVCRLRNRTDGRPARPGADVADLNEMSMRYRRGEFTQREYAEMNMALGYSVDGFYELSSFEDMDIDNPLDDEGPVYDPADVVTCDLTMTRAAAAVLELVLVDGEEALDRAASGPQQARDEARAAIARIRDMTRQPSTAQDAIASTDQRDDEAATGEKQ